MPKPIRHAVFAVAAVVCLFGPGMVTMGAIGPDSLVFARSSAPEPTPAPFPKVPQYLPWAGGRIVYVNQGNSGPRTHLNVWNRYAWDFGLAYGEPVLLGIPGVVFATRTGCDPMSSWGCDDGFGNAVIVRVSDGTCARFAHLQTVLVKAAQRLELGAQLGTVGSSGNSSGPHLHYDRADCATGHSLPSTFYEVSVPQEGMYVTSWLYRRAA